MVSELLTLASSENERRVLVLPSTRVDGIAMDKLFAAHGIESVNHQSMRQVCAALREGAGMLILAEELFLEEPDELMRGVANQPVWSNLPIIILSRAGRESARLASLVAQLGDASVVERPIRTTTLITLVKSSLRARDRQYQVREHLAEQERAQKIIREVEGRYRSLIENITDYAIFMSDAKGRINGWNNGAEAILGFTAEDVLGRSIDLLSTQEDVDAGTSFLELQRARTTGRITTEGWKLRKDGARLFMEGVIVASFDESGRSEGFAHFLRDNTEKHRIAIEREHLLESERAARSEAERAGRIKDEFLATLSHELRTPLNAVLGWAQVLRKSGALNTDAANAVNVIERNARAQSKIIADLLDMSGIMSGKVRLELQRVDLASVINATIDSIRPTAQAKGIELYVVLDPKAGPVSGDPSRLQQVFWNLLTNAMKFTARDGRVTITLSRTDSHLEIEVTDEGEGMDPAFLPHVFDRFRQADASSARRHGGLGLGLSIVKQLVEMHGGTVTAKSPGPGLGSTFRVTLPVMLREEAHESPKSPAQGASHDERAKIPDMDLDRVRVLVVDDEPDARALVERLLLDCNAQVRIAGSVGEAMALVEDEKPDVLVSDIGMPGEDGYALIRRVRALPNGASQIPAIALTAYARTDDRVKAINAGFQVHLSKPVEPVELVAMVASLARGNSTHGAAP
jgi:PAS domain S-box-containing protein